MMFDQEWLDQTSFEDALGKVAEVAVAVKLRKQAADGIDLNSIKDSLGGWLSARRQELQPALSQAGSWASKTLQDPGVQSTLGGAGIGAGVGALSSLFQPEEERRTVGRATTGALLGGLGGAALHYGPGMMDEAHKYLTGEGDVARENNRSITEKLHDAAVTPAGGLKPGAAGNVTKVVGNALFPAADNANMAGAAMGGAVGAMQPRRNWIPGDVNDKAVRGLFGKNSPLPDNIKTDPKILGDFADNEAGWVKKIRSGERTSLPYSSSALRSEFMPQSMARRSIKGVAGAGLGYMAGAGVSALGNYLFPGK